MTAVGPAGLSDDRVAFDEIRHVPHLRVQVSPEGYPDTSLRSRTPGGFAGALALAEARNAFIGVFDATA